MNKSNYIRKHKRFNLNMEALYCYETDWKPCYILDINLEGAGIILKEQLQINDNFNLKITLENEEHILKCNVVNVKSFKVGVLFTNTNEKDINFLKKLINKKIERFKI